MNRSMALPICVVMLAVAFPSAEAQTVIARKRLGNNVNAITYVDSGRWAGHLAMLDGFDVRVVPAPPAAAVPPVTAFHVYDFKVTYPSGLAWVPQEGRFFLSLGTDSSRFAVLAEDGRFERFVRITYRGDSSITRVNGVTPLPPTSPFPGHLAFITAHRTENTAVRRSRIQIARTDGVVVREIILSSSSLYAIDVAPSASGATLVVRTFGGTFEVNYDGLVMNEIPNVSALCLARLPDGRMVQLGQNNRSLEFYREDWTPEPALTIDVTLGLGLSAACMPVWNPDGQELLFWAYGGTPVKANVFAVPLSLDSARQVTADLPFGGFGQGIAYNPATRTTVLQQSLYLNASPSAGLTLVGEDGAVLVTRPTAHLAAPFNTPQRGATFLPDGRLVSRTATDQIFITPDPSTNALPVVEESIRLANPPGDVYGLAYVAPWNAYLAGSRLYARDGSYLRKLFDHDALGIDLYAGATPVGTPEDLTFVIYDIRASEIVIFRASPQAESCAYQPPVSLPPAQISDDGRFLTWTNNDSRSFVWTQESGAVDIGTLGGRYTFAAGINNRGMVVGTSETASGTYHAFVWTATGGMVDIHDLPNIDRSEAAGVNNNGMVIGWYPDGSYRRGIVWTQTAGMVDISSSTETATPIALNDNGVVVGESHDLGRGTGDRAFVWMWAGLTIIHSLGTNSRAIGVNRNGAVVGNYRTSFSSPDDRAFLWTQAQGMVDVGGGLHAWATAINDAGVVVGGVRVWAGTHAFTWTMGGGMVDLGTLGGETSQAEDIGDSGVVVGASTTTDGIGHAFVWKPGQAMRGLSGSQGYASRVADNGAILGGIDVEHRVVWFPGCMDGTPTGRDVTVQPLIALARPGQAPVTTTVSITFASVAVPGDTSVTVEDDPPTGAPPSPDGFKVGEPPVYYQVSTTAVFSGPITLCISWLDGQFFNEDAIRLFHHEGGAWVDVTTSLNALTNTVCGVAMSFSAFAMFETAYDFDGFFQPVGNPPTRNVVRAGAAVPIKFSLGKDYGLDVFDAAFPKSAPSACDAVTPVDFIEQTLTPGASSLTFDDASGIYTYVWKTEKVWAGSCRTLTVRLNDGTVRTALFSFRR